MAELVGGFFDAFPIDKGMTIMLPCPVEQTHWPVLEICAPISFHDFVQTQVDLPRHRFDDVLDMGAPLNQEPWRVTAEWLQMCAAWAIWRSCQMFVLMMSFAIAGMSVQKVSDTSSTVYRSTAVWCCLRSDTFARQMEFEATWNNLKQSKLDNPSNNLIIQEDTKIIQVRARSRVSRGFTGGTTGRQRCVPVTQRMALHELRHYEVALRWTGGQR